MTDHYQDAEPEPDVGYRWVFLTLAAALMIVMFPLGVLVGALVF